MKTIRNMFSIVTKDQTAMMDSQGLSFFCMFHRSEHRWSVYAMWQLCTVYIIVLSFFSAASELPFHVSAPSYTWTHVFFSAESQQYALTDLSSTPTFSPEPKTSPGDGFSGTCQILDRLWPLLFSAWSFINRAPFPSSPPALSWKEKAEGRKPFKGTIGEVNKRDPAGEAGWGESQQ